MKKLALLIITIFVSILIALMIKQDQGYILIAYRGVAIELSLWTGVIFLLLSFLIIVQLFKILKFIFLLPQKTKRYFQERRRHRLYAKTSLGLLRLAEGNFKQALNLLWYSAKGQKKPLINFLTAARAAQELGDIEKRDECLRLAFECSPKSGLSIGIMQANLQCINHEYEAALATLNHLQQQYGINKLVLKQLLEVYLKLKDWYKLIKLLPELTRYKILTDQEILDYEVLAAKNYLEYIEYLGSDQFHKVDKANPLFSEECETKIETFYNKELSKKAKLNYQIVKAYINSLCFWLKQEHLQQDADKRLLMADKAIEIIAKALVVNKSAAAQKDLIMLYEQVVFTAGQFKKVEKQLTAYSYNIDFLFVLGKIAIALEDFDKAYQYLNQAKKLSYNQQHDLPVNYYLAFVLLKLGREQESLELFSDSVLEC